MHGIIGIAESLIDEGRLEQIMHNLVGNAVKFTEQGTVRVSATKRDGMLAVSVMDTGIGVEPENRQRIFEAFEQGEGYEVCRRLRATSSASQMPVIYLTAKDRTKDIVEAFRTGGNDYLTKPITKEELLARVKIHLELLDANRNLERKVTERTEDLSKANAELELLASMDGLTRIPNRRLFDETLAREWADHRRRGAELAVMLFDADHFKLYNDAKGHPQGDAALVAAAIGERMRQAVLGLEIEHGATKVSRYLTLSVGVASMVPPRTGEAVSLVEKADHALYQAKESGRNRVIVAGD